MFDVVPPVPWKFDIGCLNISCMRGLSMAPHKKASATKSKTITKKSKTQNTNSFSPEQDIV